MAQPKGVNDETPRAGPLICLPIFIYLASTGFHLYVGGFYLYDNITSY